MARLLLCAFSSALLTGCLIPQDDQVIPDLPPRKNRPPRIVRNLPVEERVSYPTGSGNCIRQAFALTVEDLDTGDQIRSQWVIDRSTSSPAYSGGVINSNGTALRQVPAPMSSAFLSAMSNLTPGLHFLTAFVVDTDFDPETGEATPISRTLPDGTMVEDSGYVDQHFWVLEVAPCQ